VLNLAQYWERYAIKIIFHIGRFLFFNGRSMDISNTLLCIPNRLSEDKDSFLYHFPYNILIVRIALNQGKKSLYTFDYQSDPKTYTNWKM